jgi:hypothetical protein
MLAATTKVIAQAVPDASGAFDNIDDVPIDGGVAVLVGAGVVYGVRKLYNRKK